MIHSKHHAAYSFGGTGIGVAGSSGVSLPRSRNKRCCVVPGLTSSISTTHGNLHLYELVWVSCAFSRFYRTLRGRWRCAALLGVVVVNGWRMLSTQCELGQTQAVNSRCEIKPSLLCLFLPFHQLLFSLLDVALLSNQSWILFPWYLYPQWDKTCKIRKNAIKFQIDASIMGHRRSEEDGISNQSRDILWSALFLSLLFIRNV